MEEEKKEKEFIDSEEEDIANIFKVNMRSEQEKTPLLGIFKESEDTPEESGDKSTEGEDIDPLEKFMRTIEKTAVKQVKFGKKLEAHLQRLIPGGFGEKKKEKEKESLVFTFEDVNKMVEEKKNNSTVKEDEEETKTFINALKTGVEILDEEEEEEVVLPTSDNEHQSVIISDFSDDEFDQAVVSNKMDYFKKIKKLEKKRRMKKVDHSKVSYSPFKKNFYIECEEIRNMNENDVKFFRKELGDIKVRGVDCPRPINNWYQGGLSDTILDMLIKKYKFKHPFPIQSQALPVVMSGRDCIGIAETGSGKTLAFVLPMLRHIMYQPKLREGDGPIALIMVPTRELAQQVYSDTKHLCKALRLRCVCIYGGAGLAGQFSELKRGTEVVVCTPGRMIDVLAKSNGKITNLRRVSYVVLDEADRMFDFGFEPQISQILDNIRPDKQTVMFSATFPRNVENLAKNILTKPIEIVVGNRGQVARNVKQIIEVIKEERKFPRLLELLNIWYPKGQILIFLHKQEQADKLYTELVQYKFVPLLLHGGQDQDDRQSTINDFKRGKKNIMIATSLAARGLDIKKLVLVINYYCPSHKEDYIHRIGRTGRAGNKGTAVTFITKDEDKFSGDIIHAMQISNSEPPKELVKLYDFFMVKVRRGEVKNYSGLGNLKGNGYSFSANEYISNIEKRNKRFGIGEKKQRPANQQGLKMKKINSGGIKPKIAISGKKTTNKNSGILKESKIFEILKKTAARTASEALSSGATKEEASLALNKAVYNIIERIKQGEMPHFDEKLAHLYNVRDKVIDKNSSVSGSVVETLEINDYPESVRNKVKDKDYLEMINRLTNCRVSVRGVVVDPGRMPLLGQKKMHMYIEGDSEYEVYYAYQELKKYCEDSAIMTLSSSAGYNGINNY